MSKEDIECRIESALALVQLITEDFEGNFFGASVEDSLKRRASITVSALNALHDYLRGCCGK